MDVKNSPVTGVNASNVGSHPLVLEQMKGGCWSLLKDPLNHEDIDSLMCDEITKESK